MSDLRPEFRPLTFPRPLEAATPPAGPGATPPVGAYSEPHAPECDSEYEADDEFCDEIGEFASHHDGESHGVSPIAGRIEAARGEPTPGDLVETLLRLGQRLRGHLDGRFGAFGLSDARFAALSVIRDAAPSGCTQAHLATKLGQCESSISTLVERMRASRLLYRLRAKADRRKRVLMLTDEGRQLFEQGLSARDREAATLFERMSEEEQRQLATLVNRLIGTLDRIAETPDRAVERPAA